MSLHIIILAAGKGSRMRSNTPKVLHTVGNKPMLAHVIESAKQLQPDEIHVVIGHEKARIQEALKDEPVRFVEQSSQLGTGHACMQALPNIEDDACVLILSGDVPLIKPHTLKPLINACASTPNAISLLVALVKKPYGLGRIIRDVNKNIIGIREEKDANDDEKKINEIYSGISCIKAKTLKTLLPTIQANNAQNEYYLTDIVGLAYQQHHQILGHAAETELEITGVNDRVQLQLVERAYQKTLAHELMLSGTSLADCERIDIRGHLDCKMDCFIDVNCVFEGHVSLGNHVQIGPNCFIKNAVIADNSIIHANSVLDNCTIENHCQIGPFARIRPNTHLKAHCKIGNFVEIKNAQFDAHSKASHLSYIGDANVGQHVNIGAGVITCNYDGVNKHQTVIEDNAFVGSNSSLVAPVTLGASSTVGAGTTLRKNAPRDALTLTASPQKSIHTWKRPEKVDK